MTEIFVVQSHQNAIFFGSNLTRSIQVFKYFMLAQQKTLISLENTVRIGHSTPDLPSQFFKLGCTCDFSELILWNLCNKIVPILWLKLHYLNGIRLLTLAICMTG